MFLKIFCMCLLLGVVLASDEHEQNAEKSLLRPKRFLWSKSANVGISSSNSVSSGSWGLSLDHMVSKMHTVMGFFGMDSSGLLQLQKMYNSAFATNHLLFKRKVLNLIMRTCNFIIAFLPEEPPAANEQLFSLNTQFTKDYRLSYPTTTTERTVEFEPTNNIAFHNNGGFGIPDSKVVYLDLATTDNAVENETRPDPERVKRNLHLELNVDKTPFYYVPRTTTRRPPSVQVQKTFHFGWGWPSENPNGRPGSDYNEYNDEQEAEEDTFERKKRQVERIIQEAVQEAEEVIGEQQPGTTLPPEESTEQETESSVTEKEELTTMLQEENLVEDIEINIFKLNQVDSEDNEVVQLIEKDTEEPTTEESANLSEFTSNPIAELEMSTENFNFISSATDLLPSEESTTTIPEIEQQEATTLLNLETEMSTEMPVSIVYPEGYTKEEVDELAQNLMHHQHLKQLTELGGSSRHIDHLILKLAKDVNIADLGEIMDNIEMHLEHHERKIMVLLKKKNNDEEEIDESRLIRQIVNGSIKEMPKEMESQRQNDKSISLKESEPDMKIKDDPKDIKEENEDNDDFYFYHDDHNEHEDEEYDEDFFKEFEDHEENHDNDESHEKETSKRDKRYLIERFQHSLENFRRITGNEHFQNVFSPSTYQFPQPQPQRQVSHVFPYPKKNPWCYQQMPNVDNKENTITTPTSVDQDNDSVKTVSHFDDGFKALPYFDEAKPFVSIDAVQTIKTEEDTFYLLPLFDKNHQFLAVFHNVNDLKPLHTATEPTRIEPETTEVAQIIQGVVFNVLPMYEQNLRFQTTNKQTTTTTEKSILTGTKQETKEAVIFSYENEQQGLFVSSVYKPPMQLDKQEDFNQKDLDVRSNDIKQFDNNVLAPLTNHVGSKTIDGLFNRFGVVESDRTQTMATTQSPVLSTQTSVFTSTSATSSKSTFKQFKAVRPSGQEHVIVNYIYKQLPKEAHPAGFFARRLGPQRGDIVESVEEVDDGDAEEEKKRNAIIEQIKLEQLVLRQRLQNDNDQLQSLVHNNNGNGNSIKVETLNVFGIDEHDAEKDAIVKALGGSDFGRKIT